MIWEREREQRGEGWTESLGNVFAACWTWWEAAVTLHHWPKYVSLSTFVPVSFICLCLALVPMILIIFILTTSCRHDENDYDDHIIHWYRHCIQFVYAHADVTAGKQAGDILTGQLVVHVNYPVPVACGMSPPPVLQKRKKNGHTWWEKVLSLSVLSL